MEPLPKNDKTRMKPRRGERIFRKTVVLFAF